MYLAVELRDFAHLWKAFVKSFHTIRCMKATFQILAVSVCSKPFALKWNLLEIEILVGIRSINLSTELFYYKKSIGSEKYWYY